MGKKKTVKGLKTPALTSAKLIRLAIFVVFIAIAFTLNRYVPAMSTFGWGFTFGMLCMAVLTG